VSASLFSGPGDTVEQVGYDEVLRALQRKLPRWRDSAQFTRGDDGKVTILDQERPRP
jgi:hypothetical protein